VKSHVGGASVARQMATPKSPGASAPVSGLRFRRLLAVSDRDELYPLLVRLVRLLDGRVNIVSLANSAFWWNERTKREWAYDYYATSPSEL
jgi:CRISPR system Cascade subunit CasB